MALLILLKVLFQSTMQVLELLHDEAELFALDKKAFKIFMVTFSSGPKRTGTAGVGEC